MHFFTNYYTYWFNYLCLCVKKIWLVYIASKPHSFSYNNIYGYLSIPMDIDHKNRISLGIVGRFFRCILFLTNCNDNIHCFISLKTKTIKYIFTCQGEQYGTLGGVQLLSTVQVAAIEGARSRQTVALLDLLTGDSLNISWQASPDYHTDWNPMTRDDTN